MSERTARILAMAFILVIEAAIIVLARTHPELSARQFALTYWLPFTASLLILVVLFRHRAD